VVVALPSTAFDAGAPLPADVAVAPAPMARLTLCAGPVDGVPASDEASVRLGTAAATSARSAIRASRGVDIDM
jgi:hypothetical protein